MNRATWTAAVLLVLTPACVGAAAEAPYAAGEAVRAAVAAFEKGHFTQAPLDKQRSRSWLRTFLERLDPHRMYFLKADLQEFEQSEDRLVEEAKAGDFQFPKRVRERLEQRTKEAALVAETFLAAPHDYTVKEELPLRLDRCAANPDELRERWRLRIKAELLIEKVHGRMAAEVKTQLSGRYQRIAQQACEMSDERLCGIYLDALAKTFDPHSSYLSRDVISSFVDGRKYRSYRLGLALDDRSGRFTIASVSPDFRSAAGRPKIEGWTLLAIRGVERPLVDLVELHPDDLWSLIASPQGPLGSDTEVILELMHPETWQRTSLAWPRVASF
jgi:carboxyl-terminal processing protease